MNPNSRSKPFKINANIHSSDGRLNLPGAASSHPAASDAFALPAGTMQPKYDPIAAAYEDMVSRYETPLPWFDGPVAPPQQAQTSEARFTGDDAGTGNDAVETDSLQRLREIQEAIDEVKMTDDMPEFAREFVDESAPEPDSEEPLENMDWIMLPTECTPPPDETPESQLPVSAEGFPSLEQIVQAEMPESMPAMPAQAEYGDSLITPTLLEQALQQENAATPPQPEDPEEQLRRQQELDQFLNPNNYMLFNPFGPPGPG